MARDRAAYDASTLDWDRLRAYAKRAARETTVPKNPPLSAENQTSKPVTETVQVKGWFGRMRTEQRTANAIVTETVEVVGEHWLLDHQRAVRRNTTRHRQGEVTEETTWEWSNLVLLPDGSLIFAVVSDVEVIHNLRLTHTSKEGWATPAAEWNILDLDFACPYRIITNKNSSFEGHLIDKNHLIRHAKGVGVNLRLKDLLEGRTPDAHRLNNQRRR